MRSVRIAPGLKLGVSKLISLYGRERSKRMYAASRLQLILPVVFFVIFLLHYMVFHSITEAAVLIFPTIYALTGGPILQRLLGYNFSVAVWVGYIALFEIAVETGGSRSFISIKR